MATIFNVPNHLVSAYPQQHSPTSYRIETFNFVLTDEEEWELSQLLDHLTNAIPEEASLLLRLKMDADYYYQGALSVQTLTRHYEATSQGLDPLEVFGNLEDDILEKLSRWGFSNNNSRRIS